MFVDPHLTPYVVLVGVVAANFVVVPIVVVAVAVVAVLVLVFVNFVSAAWVHGTRVFFAVVALCWFLLSLRGPSKPVSE